MSADAVEAQHIRSREKDMQYSKVTFHLPPQSTASRKKQITRERVVGYLSKKKKRDQEEKPRIAPTAFGRVDSVR